MSSRVEAAMRLAQFFMMLEADGVTWQV
jgi:hypothetical protein